MFYFDSNTAIPIVTLWFAALVFKKAYIDRMSFGYEEYKSNKHGPRARTLVQGNSHILSFIEYIYF